jgi:tetratricopeptide (TPR) repeat protein
MKKSAGFNFFVLIFSLHIQFGATAQQTKSTEPPSLSLAQARAFFNDGLYEAVLSLGDAKNVGAVSLNGLTDTDREEWNYVQLASGIILNDAVSIMQASSYFHQTLMYKTSVMLAYHLGHHYFIENSYDEALRYLEKTDELYLDLVERQRVQFEKGVSYFTLRKFDNASPYFKKIVQEEGSVYAQDARYYLGFIAFSEKKFNDALPLFQALEKGEKYAAVVPFYLSYIFQSQGDNDKAIQYGESYLKRGGGLHDLETLQLLASIYFNRQNFSRTIDLYEQVIKKQVSLEPLQQFELGSSYQALGRYTQAISLLKPLSSSKDPIAPQAIHALGNAYLQAGDKANARSAFQYYLQNLQNGLGKEASLTVRFIVAKLSMELGFEDQAVQSLKDLLNLFPEGTDAQECREILLIYYARTNAFRQAMELLKTMEKKPEVYQRLAPRILYGRGIELVNELQYEKADQLMSEVVSFKNSVYQAPALFWRAEMAFRSERYLQTVGFLTEYLKLKPVPLGEATLENAYYNLGYAHLELEAYPKAMGYFERLYATSTPIESDLRREAALKVADCAFMEKNLAKARQFYGKINSTKGYGSDYAGFQLAVIEGIASPTTKISMLRKLERDFPQTDYATLITMELADTYMGEEQFEEAIPYLKKIPSLVDKDDELIPSSYLKWGICLYNLGRDDEAVEKYREILKQFPSSEQASVALENAKAIFVEKGRINAYQQFLESGGKSMAQLQKDSLFFQYVQTTYADGKDAASFEAVDAYIQQFPEGLFIADVMNFKAELHLKVKDWSSAAAQYSLLAAKGASKYQERALRQAGKMYFFELKAYQQALSIFKQLSALTLKPDVLLESLRGELRSCYQLKDWKEGFPVAERLLTMSSPNQEDLALSELVLGYHSQLQQVFGQSTSFFEGVVRGNNAALAAEARFQMASNYFAEQNLEQAEKFALETIETAGSYLYWVTRSYLLLADVFVSQKDYFNAKATLRSVIDNSSIPELKEEARSRLKLVEQAEPGTTKK